MARLASLLRGGYYPLSAANTAAVAALVAPAETGGALYRDNPYWERRPYTLLDPFCGEGRAVRALADAWNAVPYGVELHPERAEAAKRLLGENVLCGPAEGLESSGFDLVLSNPPYDNRVEVELTLVAAGHVAPGGLLLTVLPEPATVKVLDALTGAARRGFSLLFAAFAPDPEWKQLIAVLRRERHSCYAEAWLRAPFGAWAPPAAPVEPNTDLVVRKGEPPVSRFAMRQVANLLDAAHDVAEATEVAALLMAQPRSGCLCAASADNGETLRPLTALRPGHLAALLAAGVLNQVEVEVGGRRLALKGTTERVVTRRTVVEEGHTYRVEKRTPVASLKVLDLDMGDLEIVTPQDARFAEIIREALPALLERLQADIQPVWTELSDADREALAQVRSPHPEVSDGLLPSQQRAAAALVAGVRARPGGRGHKAAVLIGECGVGKTLTALGAWHLLRRGAREARLVVIAPPHLVPKWQREAALALPYAKVAVVKTVADVDRAMRHDGPVVLVMSETSAKFGADWQETTWYLPHLRQHRCPGCGRGVEAPRAGDKKRPVKCSDCATPLWTQRRMRSGRAKWPLARWLRRWYRGQYDLILDELHLYKAESQRGFAAYSAIVGAQKVFALTGTPYGGKSSTVFYLYFRLFSGFRAAYGWNDLSAFREQYGSVEAKERIDEEYGSSWAYRQRRRRNVKEAPGVSPGIIAWALPHSVFLALAEVAPDLRAALPPYAEHVHTVRMDGDMAARYARLRAMRDAGVADLFHGSASLFSTWMMAALGWPDNPTTDVVHRDPKTGAETCWLEGMDVDAGAKERAIVELAATEVAAGRKVAIYVGQPDVRDPAAFLTPLLEARGLSVAVLTTTVAPEDREEWLNTTSAEVLVVNPRLIEVGVDLLAYPVIVYDGIPTYSVYTLMQASRRSWRIGQTQPVDVHFFAYQGTLQATALELMAKKAAAATAYNGEELEALASLGEDTGDLLAALRERVVEAVRSGADLDAALGETPADADVAEALASAHVGANGDADEVAGWLEDTGVALTHDVAVPSNGTAHSVETAQPEPEAASPAATALLDGDDTPVSVSPETPEAPAAAPAPTREALLAGLPLSTFKGHLILDLPVHGEASFHFGAAKAAAVVEHLDAIRAFVENHPVKPGTRLGGCTVSSYRNSPVLNLPLPGVGRVAMKPFSFGVRKARALLDHVEWIVRFAVAEGKLPASALAQIGWSVADAQPEPVQPEHTQTPAPQAAPNGDPMLSYTRADGVEVIAHVAPDRAGGIDRELVWRTPDGVVDRITRPLDAATLAEALRCGALRADHVNAAAGAGGVVVERALLASDIEAMAVVGVENGVVVLEHTRADAVWELRDEPGRLVAAARPRAGVAAQAELPRPRLAFGDRSALVQRKRSNGTRRAATPHATQKVREQANAPAQLSLFDAVPAGASAPAERVEATQLALFA